MGVTVQSVETTDEIEARRARRAQYSGQISTLQLGGQTVVGLVRSVMRDAGSSPSIWTIKVVLTTERRSSPTLRYNPHTQQYADYTGTKSAAAKA
jgi:hypothetical protein